jgi:hypothetical protein
LFQSGSKVGSCSGPSGGIRGVDVFSEIAVFTQQPGGLKVGDLLAWK